MTETFFIVSVLFFSTELIAGGKPTLRRWMLLGLALGMAALLRQTALLFVPLLLWLFVERGKRHTTWWHFAIPVAVMTALAVPG